MNTHERAKKAAAARWVGARSRGVRIYIDEDAAALLQTIKPKSIQRKVASAAIRKAVRACSAT